MWFLLLWAMGIITSLVYFFIYGYPTDTAEISRVLLLHQFVVTFGLIGIIGIVVNLIFADDTAKKLGWPGGPFQAKYAFSQLGLGVMGVLSIWFHGNFWVGVLVTMYIYGLSGLWSHTQLMIQEKRFDLMHFLNLVMDLAYQTFITVPVFVNRVVAKIFKPLVQFGRFSLAA